MYITVLYVTASKFRFPVNAQIGIDKVCSTVFPYVYQIHTVYMHCMKIITMQYFDFTLVLYVTVTLSRLNYMQQTSTYYFKHNRLKYLSSVLELETFKSVNLLYVNLSNS